MKIVGHAAVYDSWSVDLGGFFERIRPGAFRRSLADGHPIFFIHSHQWPEVLGSTRSGSLRLWEDARGLAFELDVPDTSLGRDLHTLVERGDVARMSFSFIVNGAGGERWRETASGRIERDLLDVDLFEVSTVALPAYPATRVAARDETAARRNGLVRRRLRMRLAAA